MDEKTERLRDIFVEVAGEETVTESQADSRGSLPDETDVEERLESVIESMRERYDFHTSLSTAELATVVRGFYDGKSDTEIARDLDVSAKTVSRARIDLHLVTDADLDAPFDLDALREAQEDRPTAALAGDLDVSESTVRRYRRILDAQAERRVVGDRFREEFERLLADAELADRLTNEVKETGLEDATEGIETNVSF